MSLPSPLPPSATQLRERLVPGSAGGLRVASVTSPAAGSPHGPRGWKASLDAYFAVTQRGSTLATEFRAGTTAFLASSNNFVVNAQIMQHAGIDPAVSVVSGAFSAAFSSIMSGFLSNLPLGLVPSVGPNVFLAFSLVAKGEATTEGALAISATTGLLLFTLSLTPVLKVVLALVPLSIKYGLIIGTGLLTALIGLKNIGVVVPDVSPSNDIVALGELEDRHVAIAAFFLVMMATFLHHGIKGAVLLGMIGGTVTDWVTTGQYPDSLLALRSLTLHPVDFGCLLQPMMWVQVGALMLMLLFSISGAVIGSGRMAGLLGQEGTVPGSTAVYISCGVGTLVSALLGTSPILVSMSAAAGIRDGGRTGLTSVVLGLWCLLTAFFFSPLAAAIPACAVAPVLVLVGVAMIGEAKEVAWWSMQDALPAFMCAIFQPFTYSVSNGIFVGVSMSFVLFFTTGNFLLYLPGRRKALEDLHLAEEGPCMTHIKSAGVSPFPSINPFVKEDREHTPSAICKSLHAQLGVRGKSVAVAEGHPLPATRQSSPTLERAYSSMPSMRLPPRFCTSAAEVLESPPVAEEESALRSVVSRTGRSARLQAMTMIEKGARFIGLDPEEVKNVVNYRLLGGGRSTESHIIGGICGSEAQLAQTLCMSAGDFGNFAAAEAPLVAAAARRWRMRAAGAKHLDSEDVEVIQTQE